MAADERGFPDSKLDRTESDRTVRARQRRELDDRCRDMFARFQTNWALQRLYQRHNAFVLETMRAHVPAGGRVLEMGCAFGNFLQYAESEFEMHGLEYGYLNCVICQERVVSDSTATNGDAQSLPFAQRSFDCVVVKGVVAHLPEPAVAYREIERVLKRDGLLITMEGVTDAPYRALVYRAADMLGVKHDHALYEHLSSSDLKRLIRESGLEIHGSDWIPGTFDPVGYLGWGGPFTWRLLDYIEAGLRWTRLEGLFKYYVFVTSQKNAARR